MVILLLMLGISGCTKLEDKSYEDLFTEQFVPSDEDIQVIIASAYGDWRKILLFWNGYWRVQELGADEIVIPARPNGWVDAGEFRRMHEHSWVANDPNVENTWERTYAALEITNRVINDIDTSVYPLEGDAKNVALAELKVLRASYYWILCDLYGNVPIVTKSSFYLEPGFLPEQKTRKEVYDFIVQEISDNLEYLPKEKTYGRWNYWAAATLLAKMYLNAEVYSGTPQWEKCIEMCDIVLNNDAGYRMESNQKNVFVTENESSPEILFALPIEPTLLDIAGADWNAFDHHMQTLQPVQQATYEINAPPWGGMCAIPQFISTFDPDDRRLTQNYLYGQQYSSSGDSLFCGLNPVGEPLSYINEVPGVDQSLAIHGYRFVKYEIALGTTNVLANDYVLLRYADVLMMKAESLLRTGNSDAAAGLVTEVRSRAFADADKASVTGADLEEGSSYDYGLRNHLESSSEGGSDIQYGRFLDELGWEFNQEGRRRQDMIRFGIYTTKSYLSHSPNGDFRELYPIPTSELGKNPNLSQNPGY
ncbi:MAG: RagB/SusD family nutrient uptake outer membrane protein [Bacteroidales bacterium]|nr:RagB/SusD family nutrient uptake outer membrane protein [Bacteroidales bacterium]